MNIEKFDYTVNLSPALLWQYNNAEVLTSLLGQKNAWYTAEHSEFWDNFQTNIFGVLNVPNEFLNYEQHQFGLVVWSIILNVALEFAVPTPPPTSPIFGFNWQAGWQQNLNYFYANFDPDFYPFTLTLSQQQLILKLKYFTLTMRPNAPAINKFLNQVFQGVDGFNGGLIYLLDPGTMIITYVFSIGISPTLKRILTQYDALPRPAGVGVLFLENTAEIFGFGPFQQNFGHGCYIID
jgi:hypothetical protein